MSRLSSFSLQPVTAEDIPTLVRIHDEAFENDKLMHLMYGSPDQREDMIGFLRGLLTTSSTALFLKATDRKTGEIMGWSLWTVYLDQKTHEREAAATEERQKTAPDTAGNPAAFLDFYRAVAARRRKWITGKCASLLEVLAVRPLAQDKGVGIALVKAGLEEASFHKIPAWLEASSAGHAMYRKCGFHDIGDPIDMDLSDYGAEGSVKTVCMQFGLQN
ncbi:hypothetical protein DTO027I6_1856 [Penicillium roqueforti]|nr:hypothetical protein DTO039G3_307 [Penicillium roqueforti]KAI3219151.1 hypothetical protein DTO027I6_1856 [Penicillium roqueforti]